MDGLNKEKPSRCNLVFNLKFVYRKIYVHLMYTFLILYYVYAPYIP